MNAPALLANQLLVRPGGTVDADAFLDRLRQRNIKFLILTNNPLYTQRDLQHRLQRMGVNITGDHIYTSALATAQFLKKQIPDGTAFVIGETGLTKHCTREAMF